MTLRGFILQRSSIAAGNTVRAHILSTPQSGLFGGDADLKLTANQTTLKLSANKSGLKL